MQLDQITSVSHEALSERGYLILSAMVILSGIIMLIIRSIFSDRKVKRQGIALDLYIQKQSLINNSIATSIVLLTSEKIAESTFTQVKILSHCIIDTYLLNVSDGVLDILDKNNLTNRKLIDNRIETMVNEMTRLACSQFDTFIYSGMPLTSMINPSEWKISATKICADTIFNNHDNKMVYLHRELNTLKITLRNNFYETLKEKQSNVSSRQGVN